MKNDAIRAAAEKLKDLRMDYWKNNTYMSWKFWALFLVFFLLWIVWWRFVDKKQLLKISFFGVLISILSTFFDEIGVGLVIWAYPNKLVPFVSTFIAGALSFFPVCLMLIFQYFNKNKLKFYAATVFFAAIVAFLGQPLLKKFAFYELYHWSYFGSFLTIIVMAAIAHILTNLVLKQVGQSV